MAEVIEYSIERKPEKEKQWSKMYVWEVSVNTLSSSTTDLSSAKQKLQELRDWAELNNYFCQYHIVKTTITTEVLDD